MPLAKSVTGRFSQLDAKIKISQLSQESKVSDHAGQNQKIEQIAHLGRVLIFWLSNDLVPGPFPPPKRSSSIEYPLALRPAIASTTFQ